MNKFFNLSIVLSTCLTLFSCAKNDDDNQEVLAVKSINVKTPPTNVGYLTNDKLNLSGLKVRLIVDNMTDSVLDVAYRDFGTYDIKCSPDSGDVLSTPGYIEITITHAASKKSTSQSITVYNTIKDIEGNVYKTVKIGTQEWMAENLRTTKYNDNTSIPLIVDNTQWKNTSTAAYCWYQNDQTNANKNKYGAIYNKYVVNSNKICPTGWHVPTKEEWNTLFTFVSNDGHKSKEAIALKALKVWDFVGTNGTDDYGFALVPSGRRNGYDGEYWGAGTDLSGGIGEYWCKTAGYEISVSRNTSGFPSVVSGVDDKYGLAIRCIKD